MAKAKTIKATRNIYGNWNIYVGSRNEHKFGERWNAVDQLSDMLKEGCYTLSPKSEITMSDVEAHRAKLGE